MHVRLLVALPLCVASLTAHASELPRFRLPVLCDLGRTCVVQNFVDHDPSPQARDYACGTLTYEGHDGTDIRLRSARAMRDGVAVVAAAAGRVVRVRDGVRDATVRRGDRSVRGRECGNGVVVIHDDGWETQYCHMARGSLSVRPGDAVRAGDRLGRVGLSGNTEFPHLHFTVRHHGKVIDPFAFGGDGTCKSGRFLWDPSLEPALSYRAGIAFDVGFSGSPMTMESLEAGDTELMVPDPKSPVLIAFVRALGLRTGDIQRITVQGPSGASFVDSTASPLDRNKAQYLMFAGRKRTAERWAPGTYRATYTVYRNGIVVIDRQFEVRL